MFSLSPIKIWRWHCVLLGHHWLKSRIWSSLQNHRYCCQSMAIHSICLIAKSWCVCGLFIICLRLKTTTLNLRLFLFPFRGHAQHPAAHVWPGTIHLHAAVKSLPWQRETSGSHIHRRPVWQSNHTGRSPELQPNGFKWTDNWLFAGACGKQNLLLFHNSLIIVCLCKGGEIISVTHRSTEWPTCTIFTCARVASATRGHVSPSSGSPVSGWRGTCRWEMKERENCQSLLRACVGRMKRLSLSLFLFKAGHVCGDNIDIVDGQPTGSVRVSFGYMSTFEDCQKFLNFVAECFVEKPVRVDQERLQELKRAAVASEDSNESPSIKITNGGVYKGDEKKPTEASLKGFQLRDSNSHGVAYTLTNIYIYPIKSCGAYEVWEQPSLISRLSFLTFFSPPPSSTLPVLIWLCSSCRSTTGRWARWVYCMTEAGWW